ncbi:hypothetical protein ACWGB8_29825 [Kitasatospora sp. NPDC054939]
MRRIRLALPTHRACDPAPEPLPPGRSAAGAVPGATRSLLPVGAVRGGPAAARAVGRLPSAERGL